MDTKDAGRIGGSAATEAKKQAARANLERARAALREKRKLQADGRAMRGAAG